MAKNFYKPTRMCISCREKSEQENLIRLHCKDGELYAHKGVGRSFYICKTCLNDEKRVSKALMRQCRSGKGEQLLSKLKEIVTNE